MKKKRIVLGFIAFISFAALGQEVCVVNSYSAIEGGRPFKNIMKENILIPINPKQTGPVLVDLMSYNIVLNDDVIVTLEWVKNDGENKKGEAIFFSLGFFNGGTLVKQASQGKFRKFSNMGVGMNLDVRY